MHSLFLDGPLAGDVGLAEDGELMAAEGLVGDFAVFEAEDEGGAVAGAMEEGVGVVDVDFRFEEGGEDVFELAFGVDLDGEDLAFAVREFVFLEEGARAVGVIDDDPEDGAVRGIQDGEGHDMDAVGGQESGEVMESAELVGDKEAELDDGFVLTLAEGFRSHAGSLLLMGAFSSREVRDGGAAGAGGSAQAPRDARLVEVIGGHLHLDAVADGEADPAFAHFAADGGEDFVFIVEFDAEHGAWEDGGDAAFDFDGFFFEMAHNEWWLSDRAGAFFGRFPDLGSEIRRQRGATVDRPDLESDKLSNRWREAARKWQDSNKKVRRRPGVWPGRRRWY